MGTVCDYVLVFAYVACVCVCVFVRVWCIHSCVCLRVGVVYAYVCIHIYPSLLSFAVIKHSDQKHLEEERVNLAYTCQP